MSVLPTEKTVPPRSSTGLLVPRSSSPPAVRSLYAASGWSVGDSFTTLSANRMGSGPPCGGSGFAFPVPT